MAARAASSNSRRLLMGLVLLHSMFFLIAPERSTINPARDFLKAMDGWSVEGKRNKEENCYSMTVNELKKVPVPVVVVDKRHSQRIIDLSWVQIHCEMTLTLTNCCPCINEFKKSKWQSTRIEKREHTACNESALEHSDLSVDRAGRNGQESGGFPKHKHPKIHT